MAPDLEGKLGKLRRLVNEQVVDRLKDDDTRSGIIDQLKDHAGEIAGAGSAIMSKLSSGGEDSSDEAPRASHDSSDGDETDEEDPRATE